MEKNGNIIDEKQTFGVNFDIKMKITFHSHITVLRLNYVEYFFITTHENNCSIVINSYVLVFGVALCL